jgi:hypothetical protein
MKVKGQLVPTMFGTRQTIPDLAASVKPFPNEISGFIRTEADIAGQSGGFYSLWSEMIKVTGKIYLGESWKVLPSSCCWNRLECREFNFFVYFQRF